MTQGDSTVVRFEDVSLHFGDTVALDHVSFEMHAGETFVHPHHGLNVWCVHSIWEFFAIGRL